MAKAIILAAALAIHAPDTDQLKFTAGLTLSSQAEGFGGFSAMHLSPDCSQLTLASDDGWWLKAPLEFDADNQLRNIGAGEILPIIFRSNKRAPSKILRDAEALTQLPDGRLIVGFESRARLESFTSLTAPGRRVDMPDEIAKGPDNGELEAMAYVSEGPLAGKFLIVSERNRNAQGNPLAWAWDRPARPLRFALNIPEEFAITDLLVLPKGQNMLLLGRKFFPGFSSMAIFKASLENLSDGAILPVENIYEAHGPFANVDNMEGLGLCTRGGKTNLFVISDDNYLSGIQSTILYQFEWKPENKNQTGQ